MIFVRTKSCCFDVRLKSKRPTCEFKFTGVGALKRNPAVFSNREDVLSPTSPKSLAGYLAAACANAAAASGFMPPGILGKMVLSWAVVKVVTPPDGFG